MKRVHGIRSGLELPNSRVTTALKDGAPWSWCQSSSTSIKLKDRSLDFPCWDRGRAIASALVGGRIFLLGSETHMGTGTGGATLLLAVG